MDSSINEDFGIESPGSTSSVQKFSSAAASTHTPSLVDATGTPISSSSKPSSTSSGIYTPTYLDAQTAWATRVPKPYQNAIFNALNLFSPGGEFATSNDLAGKSLQHAGSLLNGGGIQHAPSAVTQQVHSMVRNQYASLFVATAKGKVNCNNSSGNSTTGGFDLAATLNNAEGSVSGALDKATASIQKTFGPVNKFVGQTLFGLTGMLKDPLGAHGIIPGIGAIMTKVNPGFAQNHEASFLGIKMEELQHLPGNIYGSMQHLQSAMSGGQLFGPVQFVKDIYLGAIGIIKSIGKFINDMFMLLQKFVYNIINSIIPLDAIMAFLQAVSQVAGTIGSITSAFGGLSQVSMFTGELAGITGQLSSIIANPLATAQRFLPPAAGAGLSFLSNPEALLSTLPPPWGTIFCILNKVSGMGYNYNMGYGLTGALAGIKSGVLAGILSAFGHQTQILSTIFNPSQPYTPDTHVPQNKNVTTPGRPAYPLDHSGAIQKDPCKGPPPAVYQHNDSGTAAAPSVAADAADAAAADANAKDSTSNEPYKIDESLPEDSPAAPTVENATTPTDLTSSSITEDPENEADAYDSTSGGSEAATQSGENNSGADTTIAPTESTSAANATQPASTDSAANANPSQQASANDANVQKEKDIDNELAPGGPTPPAPQAQIDKLNNGTTQKP